MHRNTSQHNSLSTALVTTSIKKKASTWDIKQVRLLCCVRVCAFHGRNEHTQGEFLQQDEVCKNETGCRSSKRRCTGGQLSSLSLASRQAARSSVSNALAPPLTHALAGAGGACGPSRRPPRSQSVSTRWSECWCAPLSLCLSVRCSPTLLSSAEGESPFCCGANSLWKLLGALRRVILSLSLIADSLPSAGSDLLLSCTWCVSLSTDLLLANFSQLLGNIFWGLSLCPWNRFISAR